MTSTDTVSSAKYWCFAVGSLFYNHSHLCVLGVVMGSKGRGRGRSREIKTVFNFNETMDCQSTKSATDTKAQPLPPGKMQRNNLFVKTLRSVREQNKLVNNSNFIQSVVQEKRANQFVRKRFDNSHAMECENNRQLRKESTREWDKNKYFDNKQQVWVKQDSRKGQDKKRKKKNVREWDANKYWDKESLMWKCRGKVWYENVVCEPDLCTSAFENITLSDDIWY